MCIFGGVHLSSASRKEHDCDPHIFIFLSVYFEPNLALGAMRKPLMQLRKKYIYLYHLRFCSKCFLRGKGLWINQANNQRPH